MNKLLTRKKHSKIISKLALKKGLISKELYDNLYIAEYKEYKRVNKKNKYGYRFTRYYPELHYCTTDYWGEASETSIIYDVTEQLVWSETHMTFYSDDIIKYYGKFKNTKAIIKYLRKM